jgi:hypothetical protein
MANGSTPYVMSSVIATLSQPNIRRKLFSMFLDNLELTQKLIERSYQHDNGFEKWVLFNHPLFKLRLHVYEDTRLIPQENRHNHSWDFASCILEGCLQNTIYTIDEQAGEEGLNHYQYSPIEGESYSTKLLGQKRLRKMTDINLASGTAYFMPSEVIHRISYEQTFKQKTITLMLTGNRKNYHCDLFSEHEFKEEKTNPLSFTKAQMIDRFEGLQKH